MFKRIQHIIPGACITAVLLICSIVTLVLLGQTQMVPGKYLFLLGAVLFALTGAVCALVWTVRRRKCFIAGSVLAAIALILFIIGFFVIHHVTATLKGITSGDSEVAEVAVYVNTNDEAQTLQDAADYTFGILAQIDRANTDATLKEIEKTLKQSIHTTEYGALIELVNALLDGEVGAIVMNTAFIDVLEEIKEYADITDRLREIEVKQVEVPVAPAPDTDDDGIFRVLISGVDTKGALRARSRSDVNIIATVNTNTHEVLLLTTPRDYFVELPISNGQKDKLTFAGIYGIENSVGTLEMLYDIDIDYYFRLNFSGFSKIIDAIGGVDVYSEYAFKIKFHEYQQGYNHLDGTSALAFARERYAFASGDVQRGKNQMAVIQGVINKLTTSTALLNNFTELMNSLNGCFESNVPYEQVAGLVREQLNSMPAWRVHSYNVTGKGAYRVPYSSSHNSYVMIPDDEKVAIAKEKMQAIVDGKLLD